MPNNDDPSALYCQGSTRPFLDLTTGGQRWIQRGFLTQEEAVQSASCYHVQHAIRLSSRFCVDLLDVGWYRSSGTNALRSQIDCFSTTAIANPCLTAKDLECQLRPWFAIGQRSPSTGCMDIDRGARHIPACPHLILQPSRTNHIRFCMHCAAVHRRLLSVGTVSVSLGRPSMWYPLRKTWACTLDSGQQETAVQPV
jgi:hypothetical protein